MNNKILMAMALLPALALAWPQSAYAQQNAAKTWVTVFRDDFNTLDAGKWGKWLGGVNNNAYSYVLDNAFASNGILTLRGTNTAGLATAYQSGGIFSAKTYRYGRYSIRAKLVSNHGIILGFWLDSPAPCGEIDVFEAGGLKVSNGHSVHSQHYFYPNPNDCSTATSRDASAYSVDVTSKEWSGPDDYSLAYHTFLLDWEPGQISYSVDGVQQFSSTYMVPDVAMTVKINQNLEPVAIGNIITNIIDGTTTFPTDFLVDWVQVDQLAVPSCVDSNAYGGMIRDSDGACLRTVGASFNGDKYGDALVYNASTGQAYAANGQASHGVFLLDQSTIANWSGVSQAITGDFNGDGYSDVLIYRTDGTVQIEYGQSGSFRDAPASHVTWNQGLKLIPGDFNGDGYTDVLVYGADGSEEIRYGQPTDGLRFAPQSQAQWSAGASLYAGDFNGDGKEDLLVYQADGHTEIRYGQAGDGLRFSPASQVLWDTGWKFVFGDFNGDGYTDIFLYGPTGANQIQYGQSSDGLRFAPASQTTWNPGQKLIAGDFNGDGKTDILVYAASGASEIRYGQAADGLRFSPASQVQWNPGLTFVASDFNGDGFSDLLIYGTNGASEVRYGRQGDGLNFDASTQQQWNAGWSFVGSGQQVF
jgi:beta-glucanase (GH16 family)